MSLMGVSYLVLMVVMIFSENSLIFFPSVYPAGRWNPPGLAFEDAWFQAADGTKLHGWYVPHEHPRAVVLFAHGNGGNLSGRADTVGALAKRLGLAVMIFDYRGYGRSEGRPTGAGVLADARAARAWLAKRAGVSESELVLFGESLGGAVVVDLASRDGARGLVLDRTFSSLPDVAKVHYPWLPVRLLMRTRLDSVSKIGDYHGPLLQIHGDADTLVPLVLARRLFAAAHEPKTLMIIPGGDHNDLRTGVFYQAFDEFISRL
ncbi:MAG TPA: alpha/beta hydrolase [Pirellulales bacterium]|nr:alpha/beta hydrolase [Pirellulales bacterium]